MTELPAQHRTSGPHRNPFSLALPLVLLLGAAGALLWRQKPPQVPHEITADATIADLARDVAAQRGLAFKTPPKFVPVTTDELAARMLARVEKIMPSQQLQLQRAAWVAMGFRWEPDFPIAAAIAGLTLEQEGAVYDADMQEIVFDVLDTPTVRPAERARLTQRLAKTLLEQHHGPSGWFSLGNQDAALAKESLMAADSAQTTTLCLLAAPPLTAEQAATVKDAFYASPRFLRELALFSNGAGGMLSERLAEESAEISTFDAVWQNPPKTTASILHGERTESGERRKNPVSLQVAAPGAVYSGVLGEYGVQTLLRSQLTKPQVLAGSADWAADAYFLYPEGLVWQTAWITATGAQAFAEGIAQTLTRAFGIPETAISHQENTWQVEHSNRCFRVTLLENNNVLVISATDAKSCEFLGTKPPNS